jgi:hypothetical protein
MKTDGTLSHEVAMLLVALVCAVSGLILGMVANVRALALLAVLTAPVAYFAGTGAGEESLIAILWALIGVVTLQVGYAIAVVTRAVLFTETGEVRQPVSMP